MSDFDYSQRLTRRIISDSPLERFIWDHHNFGTKYVEPFTHGHVGSEGSQSFIPYTVNKPVRVFSLDFPLLMLQESDYAKHTGLAYRPELDFSKLKDFYVRHKSYKPFIYNHPVYGDVVVRFAKPLSLPKKMTGGSGAVQGFTLELQEVVTTDYTFSKGENYSGDLAFPVGYYDVEIEYPDNSNIIPLANNYTVSFVSVGRDIRTLKLTCSGLLYFFDEQNRISFSYHGEQNMALLEMFYLKHRLNKKFTLEYMGEYIPVRFKEPLSIPKVEGNTGIISAVELTLIETPYEPTNSDIPYERTGN